MTEGGRSTWDRAETAVAELRQVCEDLVASNDHAQWAMGR